MMREKCLEVDFFTVWRRLDTTTDEDENNDNSSNKPWIDTHIRFRQIYQIQFFESKRFHKS